MRSIGSRRGNPILRASVEQMRPSAHGIVDRPAGRRGHAPGRGRRRGRVRLARVLRSHPRRTSCRACRRPLDVDGAEVRYFGAADLGLWAHERHAGPRARVRVRRHAGASRRARAPLARLPAHAHVAGHALALLGPARLRRASRSRRSDSLDVVWAMPGRWCGFVLAETPQPRLWNLPPHWRGARARCAPDGGRAVRARLRAGRRARRKGETPERSLRGLSYAPRLDDRPGKSVGGFVSGGAART